MKGYMAKKMRFGERSKKEFPRGGVWELVRVVNQEMEKKGRRPG